MIYNHNVPADETYDIMIVMTITIRSNKPYTMMTSPLANTIMIMLLVTMLVIMLAQHTDHRRPSRCKKMSPTQSVVLKSHASAGLLPASDKSSPKSPQGHWRQWTYSSITRDNNKNHQCKQESWVRNLKLLKTRGEELRESPHSTIRVIQYSGPAISLVWPPNQPNSSNVSWYNPSTRSTNGIS